MTTTRRPGRSLLSSHLSWIIVSIAAFCLHAVASAQTPSRFAALATGGQEVPPVATTTGTIALLDVNAQETAMRDIVLAARLTDATAAHINCAPFGVNGPVGVTLYSGVPVTIPGSGLFDFGFVFQPDVENGCGWTTMSDVVSAMLAGVTYINIQTLANPDGEARGQIFPPRNAGVDCVDPPNLVPDADLRNCNLHGVILHSPHLERATLIRANLTSALLDGAFLNDADLRAADFSNADMFESELPGADLRYATLRDTFYEFGNAPDANMGWADLEGSHLFFTIFDRASLYSANLRNADMSLVKLNGADLRNANMQGAFISNSDLVGIVWGNTICPDGTNSDLDDGDSFTCLSNLSRFPSAGQPDLSPSQLQRR